MGSIYYSLVAKKNPINKEIKFYAKTLLGTPVTQEELLDLAAKNSQIHRSTLEAVFYAWLRAIANYFMRGHNIQLYPLGSFFSTIRSKGAPALDSFSANYIRGLHINFVPSPELKLEASSKRMSYLLYTSETKAEDEPVEP